MTTFEPGARDVLTHGLDFRPRSIAFFASRPAAIITDGFDVLVQLVMAARTTEPCRSSVAVPSMVNGTAAVGSAAVFDVLSSASRPLPNACFDSLRLTRSCGRF